MADKKKKVSKTKKETKKNPKEEKAGKMKTSLDLKNKKTKDLKNIKTGNMTKNKVNSSSEKMNVKKSNVKHNKTQKSSSVRKEKNSGKENVKDKKKAISSDTKSKSVSTSVKITSSKKSGVDASKKNQKKNDVKNNVKQENPVEKGLNNKKQKTASSPVSETTAKKKGKNWEEKFGFKQDIQGDVSDHKKSPALVLETPKQEKDDIPKEKISDITSQVTSPGFSTSFSEIKKGKEPEGKFEMEFLVKCSPDLLFEFLYTPSGLAEWFCDDVNIRNGVYTFNWKGEISQARLLKMNEGERVRYQWVNRTDGAYFEFRIVKDELTGDVSLFITDFADPPWDIEGNKLLWKKQIEKLLKLIGSLY
jgi:uncharacterized protein YndB with AHSA1/START domain